MGVFGFEQTDVLWLLKFVTVEVYFHSLRSSGFVVSRVLFPSATSSQIQISRGDVAMDSPIVVVHRRPSTSARVSQSDFRISWLLRQNRVERLHRDEDVRGDVRLRGSTRVQTRRHRRGGRSLPYQATVSQPADHPAISVLRDRSEEHTS